MSTDVDMCKPASGVLGTEVGCSGCPFPFCVVAEMGSIRELINEQAAYAMRSLGRTVQEVANAIGVSLRTVQRYTGQGTTYECPQCNMVHSKEVACRSQVYSVIPYKESYITLLNRHGQATKSESSAVELFIDYTFPDSIIQKHMDGHDYWMLSRVSIEEANNFKQMCSALDSYISSQSSLQKLNSMRRRQNEQ